MAPEVWLWSVKVLATASSVAYGLNWVLQHKETIDVVNISISGEGTDGPCAPQIDHEAICKVVPPGIPVIAVAGKRG